MNIAHRFIFFTDFILCYLIKSWKEQSLYESYAQILIVWISQLLRIYHMPGTVLGIGGAGVSMTATVPSLRVHILVGEADIKQIAFK